MEFITNITLYYNKDENKCKQLQLRGSDIMFGKYGGPTCQDQKEKKIR
jgi:hypothetical protein